jgi:hypothetical protein
LFESEPPTVRSIAAGCWLLAAGRCIEFHFSYTLTNFSNSHDVEFLFGLSTRSHARAHWYRTGLCWCWQAVFVGGFQWYTTDQQLKEYCEKAGVADLKRIVIDFDPDNGRSWG